jgi:hypothetical protein
MPRKCLACTLTLGPCSACPCPPHSNKKIDHGIFSTVEILETDGAWAKTWKTVKNAAVHGTNVDIHDVVEEDELIAAMHERAEKFDPQAELVFGYLQVGADAGSGGGLGVRRGW